MPGEGCFVLPVNGHADGFAGECVDSAVDLDECAGGRDVSCDAGAVFSGTGVVDLDGALEVKTRCGSAFRCIGVLHYRSLL